jgi:hypothetical protein
VQEWEEYLRFTVTAFVREALRGVRVDPRTLQALSSFFDFRTFSALRTRGVGVDRAARLVAGVTACQLGLQADKTATKERRQP